ncbi:MAG TPA: cation diffusion facilitator family transporter [Pseudonocardia sp.]|jgi:cation diffusion facilitator family transporter|nr:cation diffusion facilitator family transporter [Pseudonocardia sp.]
MADGSSDDRALRVSVWVSAGFAVTSLVWGLLAGSLTIVFDGLYSFASVGLSFGAVLALRTARAGADERYPWGREVWEPLTVLVKAAALGALCVYALVGAVGELARGGREVAVGWAVGYAVLATAAGFAVTVYLRRSGGSDLVRAEAAEWAGDTWLSVGVLVGFVVALVLRGAGRDDIALYVDPAMVALGSAAFLWVPARLVRSAFRELLTMAPAADVLEPLRACASETEAAYGFLESFVRASKVGGRLDVEMDFVVGPDSLARDVDDFDAVRARIHDQLAPLADRLSMSVGFSADRRWVA